jgi:subtilisin family serine protease
LWSSAEGESVVKKRNRFGRQHKHSSRRSGLGFLGGTRKRGPKTRSFERLEDRFCFSAVPNVQTISLSSDTPDGAAALWLRELEWAARQAAAAGSTPVQYIGSALPSDPLFASQWHLLNTGQEVGNPDFQSIFGVAGEDINVVPAWDKGYTGQGVLIAVNDTGVQTIHPDLLANLHPSLRFNAITGTNNANPSLFDPAGFHGTAVAGLIAATANNGIGGVGVAPGAIIAPVLMLGPAATTLTAANAFNFATQNGIDITNNSWQAGIPRTAIAPTPFEIQTLRDSILFGRDGLGIIHVKATGNFGGPAFNPGFQTIGNWDSSNYDGYNNSRYIIAVGGVDHDGQYANVDGTFTAYPEAGTNILVVAPTGSNAALNIADDTGLGSGLWTTDLVGDFAIFLTILIIRPASTAPRLRRR